MQDFDSVLVILHLLSDRRQVFEFPQDAPLHLLHLLILRQQSFVKLLRCDPVVAIRHVTPQQGLAALGAQVHALVHANRQYKNYQRIKRTNQGAREGC